MGQSRANLYLFSLQCLLYLVSIPLRAVLQEQNMKLAQNHTSNAITQYCIYLYPPLLSVSPSLSTFCSISFPFLHTYRKWPILRKAIQFVCVRISHSSLYTHAGQSNLKLNHLINHRSQETDKERENNKKQQKRQSHRIMKSFNTGKSDK
ncbi:hypothetical protein F5Y17DRAFT_69960 [Xylariaceae sp. FL0594]|nr:hypothetical protein F5Y17DRAFT_69960 [Xylariaceae sp. FL0594]